MTMINLGPMPQASFAGWFSRLLRILTGGQGLDALEPQDRRRLLDDVKLKLADLDAVLRARHVDELLPVAMACHGIDALTLERRRPDVMRDLRRACAHCAKPRVCRNLLADADLDAHRRLCPNADAMDAIEL
ncbi:hypothetical protein [Azospirillum sp. sgz302134]